MHLHFPYFEIIKALPLWQLKVISASITSSLSKLFNWIPTLKYLLPPKYFKYIDYWFNFFIEITLSKLISKCCTLKMNKYLINKWSVQEFFIKYMLHVWTFNIGNRIKCTSRYKNMSTQISFQKNKIFHIIFESGNTFTENMYVTIYLWFDFITCLIINWKPCSETPIIENVFRFLVEVVLLFWSKAFSRSPEKIQNYFKYTLLKKILKINN